MFRPVPFAFVNKTISENFSESFIDNIDGSVQGIKQVGSNYLLVGAFTTVKGVFRNNICMIDVNGNLVTSFNENLPAITTYTEVSLFTELPRIFVDSRDNKIYISAEFEYNLGVSDSFTTRRNILVLNSDGTPDVAGSVDLNVKLNSSTARIYDFLETTIGALTPGLMIVGNFTSYDSTSVGRIARIRLDNKSIDNSFNQGVGFNDDVYSIVSGGGVDTQYICGGRFTSFKGTPRNKIAFITNIGNNNNTFLHPSVDLSSSFVHDLENTSTGQVLIAGYMNNVGGVAADDYKFYEVNSTDCSVQVVPDQLTELVSIAFQIHKQIGSGTGYFIVTNYGLYSYATYPMTNGQAKTKVIATTNNNILSVVPVSENIIIAVGLFTNVNGTPVNRIIKYNTLTNEII